MSDKNNIDKLFKEKLHEFEATPDASVWDGISQQLDQDVQPRKAVPLCGSRLPSQKLAVRRSKQAIWGLWAAVGGRQGNTRSEEGDSRCLCHQRRHQR